MWQALLTRNCYLTRNTRSEASRRLLQHIISDPHRTMVMVAICLGLRRSQLAGLKWSDFDWIGQEVLIRRSVIANRVDAVKTKKSKSRLPLAPELIEVLQEWRRFLNSKQTVIGCGHRPGLQARCRTTRMPFRGTTSSPPAKAADSEGWAG